MKYKAAAVITSALIVILSGCGGKKSFSNSSVYVHANEYIESSGKPESLYAESYYEEESQASVSIPSNKPNGSSKPTSAKIPQSSIAPRETVRVTIPEGYTISQIGDLFAGKKVCSKADFMEAISDTDFSKYYPFVNNIPKNNERCYRLEGYLYPDTYEFYTGMSAEDAIGKLLRGAGDKLIGKYSHSKLSFDQIVTLASIIEKEVANDAEMKKVSSVFHNRLNINMKLQADSTINYIERYVKPNLTGDKDRFNSFYNTYKCAALSAGPICSPSTNALKAAINPAETEYLFFASDKAGKYYYAKTYEEHLENCKAADITEEKSE